MSLRDFGARAEGFYQRQTSRLFFRRPFQICSEQPFISFSFDDFPKSAIQVGGQILMRHGLRGTYYASLGLMGKEAPTGRIFDLAELKMVTEVGHELGCHTYSHCDSWGTAPAAFEQSIVENRAALRQYFPHLQFGTFSYPITVPRPLTKFRTSRHFVCCRGGGQSFNVGKADLNQLQAYFLEKVHHRIDPVKEIIDGNARARGWLIFATHDIADNPTRYGCRPQFFEDVVKYAIASGACILPVTDALAALKSGRGLDHARRLKGKEA